MGFACVCELALTASAEAASIFEDLAKLCELKKSVAAKVIKKIEGRILWVNGPVLAVAWQVAVLKELSYFRFAIDRYGSFIL